ncbi:MAG TPA: HEAT repeat domain-containing protein [Anaeromyxobacteraceae bacterium]|nr:HEAT repeat domain-containing protein [Anaeromyxobacteraceae bacterium]
MRGGSLFRTRRLAALGACLAVACGRGGLDSPDPERRARAVESLPADDRAFAVLLVAQGDASPRVRLAVAEALGRIRGPRAAEALGALLPDTDPAVASAAARGLAAMPAEPHAREALLAGYGRATPPGRAAIADALDRIGTSLREAVELEARRLWDRNAAAASGSDPAARAGALEELGASARAEAVAYLLPLVDAERRLDPALVAAAARGLGQAGDWSVRQRLEALLEQPHGELGEAAAQALGALGDPAAADALAASGAAGSSRLAAAATDALARLPQAPDVGLALCDVAARTLDPAVAGRAAREARLREAACPERVLLGRLGRGGDEAGLAAISEVGLAPPRSEAAAERVLALLEGGRLDPAARASACRALGRLGWSGAIPALVRRADDAGRRIAEARARWIAGALPSRPAPGFAGTDAGGRLAAVVGRDPAAALVAEAGTREGREWIDRVSPADASELGALLAALGALRVEAARPRLQAAARDPHPVVRAGAVEGLAALGGEGALDAVGAAVEDADPRVRAAAVTSLSRFGARAVPILAREAERRAGPEREAAVARALGETDAPEAVPVLASLLEGPGAAEAARSLGRLGVADGAAPLSSFLAGPSSSGRLEAIEALGQLSTGEGADELTRHLTSDRPEVRAAAARALGRLRHEPASARLEALRSDYYGSVRRAAVEALAKLPTGKQRGRP